MNDQQYDVLDELYFVVSFEQLKEACGLPNKDLISTLLSLYRNGWIRVLEGVDEDASEPLDLVVKHADYFYLASKKGLLAHNSN